MYLVSTDMYKLINYVSFVGWLAVGLSVVALLYFRWKRPNMKRPIKVTVIIRIALFQCLSHCLQHFCFIWILETFTFYDD